MAILSAQAKLYNAFKCLVVDKNATATITSTATVSCGIGKLPFIRAGIRTAASVTAQGGFSIYGGVAKGANTLQTTATLRCKFPTYVKLDWDKLGMPEATNVVLQIEEGFVLEGVYAETNNSPLPKNTNLFSFRTPKQYRSALVSQLTLTNLTTRIKQLASSVVSAASVVANITYNPGRFASLEMSNFNVVPTAVKQVRGAAGIVSAFTFPIGNFRLRLASSNFDSSVATMTTVGIRPRVFTVATSSNFTTTADGLRTAILVPSAITANTSINTVPVKTTGAESNITASASMSTNAVVVRSAISPMTATTSISAPLFDILLVMQTDLVSTDYRNLAYTPNTTVTIPMLPRATSPGYSINALVDWGDGTSNTYTDTNQTITHTYSQHGTYNISIGVTSGSEFFRLGASSYSGANTNWTDISDTWYNKIKTVKSWGVRNITPFINPGTGSAGSDFIFIGLFARTAYPGLQVPSNLPYVDRAGSWQNKPDLRIESMFEDSKANPTGVTTWNLAGFRSITASQMFKNAKLFNQPIGNWETARFDRGSYTSILQGAELFNQSLGNWKFPLTYTDGTSNMSPFNVANSAVFDFSEFGDYSEENWNRTMVGWAQYMAANNNTAAGIGNIRRNSGANNTATVYASGAYGDGEAAYYYLDVTRGWTFLGYGT